MHVRISAFTPCVTRAATRSHSPAARNLREPSAADEGHWVHVHGHAGAPVGDPVLEASEAVHKGKPAASEREHAASQVEHSAQPNEPFASRALHKLRDVEESIAAHAGDASEAIMARAERLREGVARMTIAPGAPAAGAPSAEPRETFSDRVAHRIDRVEQTIISGMSTGVDFVKTKVIDRVKAAAQAAAPAAAPAGAPAAATGHADIAPGQAAVAPPERVE